MRDALPPLDRWSALGLAGVGATAYGLWYAGPVGLFAGVALAACWLVTPFGAAALGSVVAGAILPAPAPSPAAAALVTLGLAATVAGELRDASAPSVALGAFAALALGAAVLPALSVRFDLWRVAGGLALVVALAAYALYRYELVRLGLVEVDA
ncbi:hypothetical protein [Halomarina pelagica]|uniref:hypothetical protein n=1 Tax=Halomarina pelagica TaxID=2961599 RepID=UPI0020C3EB05|nr:hypothetical protein [Halomarina sp. BND7]